MILRSRSNGRMAAPPRDQRVIASSADSKGDRFATPNWGEPQHRNQCLVQRLFLGLELWDLRTRHG